MKAERLGMLVSDQNLLLLWYSVFIFFSQFMPKLSSENLELQRSAYN